MLWNAALRTAQKILYKILFSTRGRKLHQIYYLLFILSYL